jgi:hypothetical protein
MACGSHRMNTLTKTGLAALLAYSTHYAVTKVYSTFCVPDGMWGFIQGSITSGSPICASTFSIMSHTHVTYSTIVLTSLSRLIIDALADFPTLRRRRSSGSASPSGAHEA